MFLVSSPSDIVREGGSLAHSKDPSLGAGVDHRGGHIPTSKDVGGPSCHLHVLIDAQEAPLICTRMQSVPCKQPTGAQQSLAPQVCSVTHSQPVTTADDGGHAVQATQYIPGP